MNSLVMLLAVQCVRAWTWLYTWRMPPALRETRRAEIESDLWEFRSDAAGDDLLGSALHMLLRLLIGMPDDVGWRVEHASSRNAYAGKHRARRPCGRRRIFPLRAGAD